MKISKLIKPFIVLIWFLNINIIVCSQSKQLIYQGASQGTEWAVYLLNKNISNSVNELTLRNMT